MGISMGSRSNRKEKHMITVKCPYCREEIAIDKSLAIATLTDDIDSFNARCEKGDIHHSCYGNTMKLKAVIVEAD